MTYQGRRATSIENEVLRVTVLEGGGHIAEILDKRTGISPLWIPHWKSIEPREYDRERHPEYGAGADASLLASLMGHNLCLDIFGGPSAEEAAAGLPAHGEPSVAPFMIEVQDDRLAMLATLPNSQLRAVRHIVLAGHEVSIRESVENLVKTPGKALEDVTANLGDHVGAGIGDKVTGKISQSGGPSGILKDAVKGLLPFGGGYAVVLLSTAIGYGIFALGVRLVLGAGIEGTVVGAVIGTAVFVALMARFRSTLRLSDLRRLRLGSDAA